MLGTYQTWCSQGCSTITHITGSAIWEPRVIRCEGHAPYHEGVIVSVRSTDQPSSHILANERGSAHGCTVPKWSVSSLISVADCHVMCCRLQDTTCVLWQARVLLFACTHEGVLQCCQNSVCYAWDRMKHLTMGAMTIVGWPRNLSLFSTSWSRPLLEPHPGWWMSLPQLWCKAISQALLASKLSCGYIVPHSSDPWTFPQVCHEHCSCCSCHLWFCRWPTITIILHCLQRRDMWSTRQVQRLSSASLVSEIQVAWRTLATTVFKSLVSILEASSCDLKSSASDFRSLEQNEIQGTWSYNTV